MIPLIAAMGALLSAAPPRPDPLGGVHAALTGLGQLQQNNQFKQNLSEQQRQFGMNYTQRDRMNQESANEHWASFNQQNSDKRNALARAYIEQAMNDPTGKTAAMLPEFMKTIGFSAETPPPDAPAGSENWHQWSMPPVQPATTRDPYAAAQEGAQIRADAEATQSGQPAAVAPEATTPAQPKQDQKAEGKAIAAQVAEDVKKTFYPDGPPPPQGYRPPVLPGVSLDPKTGEPIANPGQVQSLGSEDADWERLQQIRAQNDAKDAAEADQSATPEPAPTRGEGLFGPGRPMGGIGSKVELLPNPNGNRGQMETLPNPNGARGQIELLGSQGPAIPVPGQSVPALPQLTSPMGLPLKSYSETIKGKGAPAPIAAPAPIPQQEAAKARRMAFRSPTGELIQVDLPGMAAIDAQRSGAVAKAIGDLPLPADALPRTLAALGDLLKSNPNPDQVRAFYEHEILPLLTQTESTKRAEFAATAAGARAASGRGATLDYDTGMRAAGRALQDPGVMKTMAAYPEAKKTLAQLHKDPNSVSDAMLQRSFAKAANSGALSEADARAPEAFQNLKTKILAWVSKNINGQLLPEERQQMEQYLQTYADFIENEARDSYESEVGAMEQSPSPSHEYNRGFVMGTERIYGKFPFYDPRRVRAIGGGAPPAQTPPGKPPEKPAAQPAQPAGVKAKTPADEAAKKALGI